MKIKTHLYFSLLVFLIFCFTIVTHGLSQVEENYNDVRPSYAPGEWWPNGPTALHYTPLLPNDKPFNLASIKGRLPRKGYPMRPAIFVDLNDTLQFVLGLKNPTNSDYSLIGENIQLWFAPQVFRNDDDSRTSIPLMDSTELKYRFRGWRASSKPMSPQNKIPAKLDGSWSIVLDVWNLPIGFNTLVVAPTNSIPSSFFAISAGDVYEYRNTQNLADTVNAYEGCFWRSIYDTNYTSAKKWIEKILDANPTSVPGWWLRSYCYRYLNDTTEVKFSLDKAINYLSDGDDPAMPDSTKRPLFPAEKHYLDYCKSLLTYERSRYAP